jgi:hypothetical protein
MDIELDDFDTDQLNSSAKLTPDELEDPTLSSSQTEAEPRAQDPPQISGDIQASPPSSSQSPQPASDVVTGVKSSQLPQQSRFQSKPSTPLIVKSSYPFSEQTQPAAPLSNKRASRSSLISLGRTPAPQPVQVSIAVQTEDDPVDPIPSPSPVVQPLKQRKSHANNKSVRTRRNQYVNRKNSDNLYL